MCTFVSASVCVYFFVFVTFSRFGGSAFVNVIGRLYHGMIFGFVQFRVLAKMAKIHFTRRPHGAKKQKRLFLYEVLVLCSANVNVRIILADLRVCIPRVFMFAISM